MALLTFGEFRLDTNNKRLWRGEQLVDLSGIHLAVLCHLVERSAEPSCYADDGQLVTKRELRELFWRDVQVSEETLRSCMSVIRKALGDDSQHPRYIKTHSREGWRFIIKATSSQPKPDYLDHVPRPYGAHYDPKWYVERPHEEREILGCVEYPGRPVVVYGPQDSGKSFLISHALESALQGKTSEPTSRVIRVNVRRLAEEHLGSLDEMLQQLGRKLLDPNDAAVEQTQATLSKYWAKELDGKLKLKRLVRSEVLKPGQVVYLVLANVEHLASWRFQSNWFDMFRAWQEVDDLAGLRLIVETAIPPRLFSLGGHSPLWTKSRRIPVPGLDASQIAQMAKLYRLQPAISTCKQLGEMVGGLAMLCSMAMYNTAIEGKPLEEVMKEYQPIQRKFGMFQYHMEDIQHWVDYQEQFVRGTPTTRAMSFKLLSAAARGITLTNEEAWPAVRKGLLRETEERGVYRLRCRLYEDYFTESAS